jgi:hypothetical protein
MTFNKLNLIYVILLAILLVCGILLFSTTIVDVVRQREALRNDVKRISEDFLRQPSLKEVERNIDKKEADINNVSKNFFVPVTDEFEFAKSLENLAGEGIIQKVKFDISKKTEEKGYVSVPLEITAESDFSKILGYIERLEKINYFFVINSVEIADLKSGGSGPAKVGAAIRGFVYWF